MSFLTDDKRYMFASFLDKPHNKNIPDISYPFAMRVKRYSICLNKTGVNIPTNITNAIKVDERFFFIHENNPTTKDISASLNELSNKFLIIDINTKEIKTIPFDKEYQLPPYRKFYLVVVYEDSDETMVSVYLTNHYTISFKLINGQWVQHLEVIKVAKTDNTSIEYRYAYDKTLPRYFPKFWWEVHATFFNEHILIEYEPAGLKQIGETK